MKQIRMSNVVLAALIMLLCVQAVAAEDIVNVATGEWAPYTGKELTGYGVCAEIVTEAFKAEDVKCDYTFYPWKRAFFLVKSGQVVCSMPWSKRILDRTEVAYSDPILEHRLSFFFLKKKYPDGVKWKTTDDLKIYRIGVPRGYLQEKTFKEKGLTIVIVNSFTSGIRMLQKGYIDLLLENTVVGKHVINAEFAAIKADVGEQWTRIEPEPLVVLFSNNHRMSDFFRRKFNKGLAAIRENGTYNMILNKYQ